MKNLFKKKGNFDSTTQNQEKSKLSLPKVDLFNKKDNQPTSPQSSQQPMQNIHNPEFTQQQFQQNNYQQPPTSAYASTPNIPLPNNNNKKNQMLLITLVIIIGIIVIAVAAFFLLGDDKPASLDTAETTVATVETTTETPETQGSLEDLAAITAGSPETEVQTTENTVEPTTDNSPTNEPVNAANTNNVPDQPLDETDAQIAAAFSGQPLNKEKQKFDETSINDLTAPILIENEK